MSTRNRRPGYHVRQIERGELGEVSKIKEEFEEFLDAHEQGAKVMELCELADLNGAIRAYLRRHYPGICMDDLDVMRRINERAFLNGRRH